MITSKDITSHVALALVELQRKDPSLTAEQVLRALETLRYRITEDLLKERMK